MSSTFFGGFQIHYFRNLALKKQKPWGNPRMVNAATFSSGAALLSLGLSVYETLLAQTIGALLLVIGLCLNAAAGVKHLGEVHRDLMT